MKKNPRIANIDDIQNRIKELDVTGQSYLDRMQADLTSLSTYIPMGRLKDTLNLDSFSDVTTQLSKHGLSLGVLVPMFLNNTFFKNRDDATKALVSSLALVLDDKVDLKLLVDRIIKYFSSEEGERHLVESKNKLRPSVGITPRTYNETKE